MNALPSEANLNARLAQQLREIAARLELDEVPHRPRAYRRAADAIQQQVRPVSERLESSGAEGLEEIRGVGPHIARLVAELIETGGARELQRLRRKAPLDVMELLAVDGIGPRTLKQLWKRLGIHDLAELEAALAEGRVRQLPGFGVRREERLRQAVRIRRAGRDRVPRKKALPIARRLRDRLRKDPGVARCEIAGSLRRGSPTVGDIDLVAEADDPQTAAALLLADPAVAFVYSRGPKRVSVRLRSGIDVDLRTVPTESFGSAWLYFTGSRAHTVALRRLALAQGLRLNEYGLFRGDERVGGRSEEEIYRALSLPYLPPESRRGESEVRDALRRRAPRPR
ncbi:MAG: helix-hairpin-helix domain-containing protein [Myxococcota bacterium]|nr:helix-hairpin-helix domain-containing protein [Myxococcota bacterium]